MLKPGEPIQIEHKGQMIQAVCLGRSRQREVVKLMTKLAGLDESIESIQAIYDIADEMLEICCPEMSDEQKDILGNDDVFEIVGNVLKAHTLDVETKKKFELPA